jgi:hypothetical protein
MHYHLQKSYIKFPFLSSCTNLNSNYHFESQTKLQYFLLSLLHVTVNYNLDFKLFNFQYHFKEPSYLE